MKYYKAPDNSIHVIESENFESLLPDGSVEIDEKSAIELARQWSLDNSEVLPLIG